MILLTPGQVANHKNEVLMKKQMRFDHPSNFFSRIFFIMFSQPEVERKFQQKKFSKKTRQTAASIPGWIDAASTMG